MQLYTAREVREWLLFVQENHKDWPRKVHLEGDNTMAGSSYGFGGITLEGLGGDIPQDKRVRFSFFLKARTINVHPFGRKTLRREVVVDSLEYGSVLKTEWLEPKLLSAALDLDRERMEYDAKASE